MKSRLPMIAMIAVVAGGIGGYYMQSRLQTIASVPQRLYAFCRGCFSGSPHHRQISNDAIRELSNETIDESMIRLADNQSFSYPSFNSDRKLAQLNLERMLSERRAIKVIDYLLTLESDEREAKCRRLFEDLRQQHAAIIDAGLDHVEDPTAPGNRQSLAATQLALCTVIFAAVRGGHSELVFEQLEELECLRRQIDQRFDQQPSSYPLAIMAVTRDYCVPDERFQLNALYVLAMKLEDEHVVEQIEQLCAGFSKSEIPIVPWNARTTWFDLTHRVGGDPIDTRWGVTTFEFFDDWPSGYFLNRDAQRELVGKVRDVLQAPGGGKNPPSFSR